jgi:hypothetical protein
MKKLLLLFAFSLIRSSSYAQEEVYDQAIVNQEQRMVFQQWNQDDFYPKAGFLDLNPYYWLVWGLFYPDYHDTDLRPLSPTGPQTQRLALVGTMSSVDNNYKLNSDTVRNTALSQIANTTGAITDVDPLWLLYYKQEFSPLLNYSAATLLAPLSTQVSTKLVSEGTYGWYTNELSMLKERVQGAHTTDMDRGSRILAYYRLLKEYRVLAGVWAIRISTAQKDIQMAAQQQQLRNGQVAVPAWTPQTDITIANQVLQHAGY